MELKEFLVRAKKNTYASGAKEIILPDSGKEIIYEEDNFKYRDRYYGFNPFSGQELVLKNNEHEWSMNYYGIIFSDKIMGKITEEEIYKFLRESLNLTPGTSFLDSKYPSASCPRKINPLCRSLAKAL